MRNGSNNRSSGRLWLCALLVCPVLQANEIYRWVDADGVVHFSQTPPPAQPVETVEIEDTRPSDYDPEVDHFGVAEQQARMAALREDMAQKREEALERKRQAEARQPQQRPVEERYDWPYYRRGFLWPRPPMPPRPPGVVLPIVPPGQPPDTLLPPLVAEPY